MKITDKTYKCPHCDKQFYWGQDSDSDSVTQEGCGTNAHWKLKTHMESTHPEKMFTCQGYPAYWSGDDTCSACGSITPDKLFKAIEMNMSVTGTDKNYKLYVDVVNDEEGKNTIYMSASHPQDAKDWILFTEEDLVKYDLPSYYRTYIGSWVKIEKQSTTEHCKFYFYHFSPEEQQKFIQLYNDKKINTGQFGIYTTPYFARRA